MSTGIIVTFLNETYDLLRVFAIFVFFATFVLFVDVVGKLKNRQLA